MKKKVLSIALVVAMIAIIAAGSLAYFTDTDSATNTFTSGNVDIKLDEAKVVKVDNDYKPTADRVQSNKYENLYPGQFLPKDPTVTNTGSQDAYVRVKVAFPSIGDNAQKSFSDVGLLFGIGSDNFVFGDFSTYNLEALFEDFDSDKWTVEQTDYNMPFFGVQGNNLVLTFTYNEVLEPGESVVLFTGVNIDPDIEYAFDVQMDITAEAIQADGFASAGEAFAAYDAA